MKLNELFNTKLATKSLTEAPKKPQFGEMQYGTWTIKFRTTPRENGTYEAIGMHTRNPSTPKVAGKTRDEAITLIKKEIDRHAANDKTALLASRAVIDYNVAFTRAVVSETGVTGVRLVKHGSDVYLVIAGVEYLDAFGNEIYGPDKESFTKLHVRKAGSDEPSGAGTLYCSSISTSTVSSLGLRPNARYALEYVNTDSDYGHQNFKLIFDSDVLSKEDKRRLNEPGLTIAVF